MSFGGSRGLTCERMPSPSTTQEQELLEAARGGDENAFARPARAVPGRAARALLPDARLGARRRGRAAGRIAARLARTRKVRGPQLAAVVALHDRHQHLPEPDRAAPETRAAGRLRPRRRPARRSGRAGRRVGVARALPGRDARRRGRPRGPGGALRAARERRARVHRGASAPAPEPARSPDPARGARLLGTGGGGLARDVRGIGEQRPSAGPQDRRGAPARAEPAGHAARARRRRAAARSWSATSTRGSENDFERSSTMLAEDATFAMPPLASWFGGREEIATFLAGWPMSGSWRWRPLRARERPAGASPSTAWDEDEQATCRSRSTC